MGSKNETIWIAAFSGYGFVGMGDGLPASGQTQTNCVMMSKSGNNYPGQFYPGSVPIYQWGITNGQWDSMGQSLLTPYMATDLRFGFTIEGVQTLDSASYDVAQWIYKETRTVLTYQSSQVGSISFPVANQICFSTSPMTQNFEIFRNGLLEDLSGYTFVPNPIPPQPTTCIQFNFALSDGDVMTMIGK